MEIRITGINVIDRPKKGSNGDTLLAFVDVEIDWLMFKRAALVRMHSGKGVTVFPPFCRDTAARVGLSQEVRDALTAAVLPVYREFGGEADQ